MRIDMKVIQLDMVLENLLSGMVWSYGTRSVPTTLSCSYTEILGVDSGGFSRYDVAGEKKIVTMENNMKPYEYLEHTADIGMVVRGKDLSELLTNAAQGLFETIAVVETVDERASTQIRLTAESVEDLFVAWLDELIFQHETKEIFFKRAAVQQCSETEVSATVYGELANFDKHEVYTEIKSVTYHQLQVVQKPDGSWFAQVIFDL